MNCHPPELDCICAENNRTYHTEKFKENGFNQGATFQLLFHKQKGLYSFKIAQERELNNYFQNVFF
jgi:hypothetical protein